MISAIKNIANNKVARNTAWIIAERIIQMILSLIIGSLSARYLGPSNYGLLNYGASLVAIFTVITKLGLDAIIVKQYVEKPKQNGNLIASAVTLRIASGILSIILIYITCLLLKPGESLLQILAVLQSISLIFQSYEIFDLWFQSKLKSKYVSIAKIIAYTIASIYKVYLLISSKSVEWFALSTTLDYLVIFFILLVTYKKQKGQRLSPSKNTSISLLKESYHFIISGLIVIIYTQIDKIMIGGMLDERQVGLYSAATTICMLWGFIPDAIINSFRPVIYKLKKENEALYRERLKQLYSIIFWIGVAFCAAISIFSNLIIHILYGNDYIGAIPTLLITVWCTLFAHIGSARSVWVVCENKNKYIKRYVAIGAIIDIILNILLIKAMGINGAAIATLITQITVSLIAPLLYKETRESTKIILGAINPLVITNKFRERK